MSPRKHPPKLVRSPLTGRVYIVTRYKVLDGEKIQAQEKFDVTDEFVALHLAFFAEQDAEVMS